MEIEKNIILFDGVCNLCNSSVDFILKRDKMRQFQFVALQSKSGEELVDKYGIPKETDSVVLINENMIFIESEAAIEIVKLLPTPWNWLASLKIIPIKLRNSIYKWIARNRYRWFGKRKECRII